MLNFNSRAYFKSRFKPNKKREAVWAVLAKYIQRDVNPDGCLLDLGAGYCFFINNIRAQEKHAVDSFDEIKTYAARDVQTHICSCTNLTDFNDNYFDTVFISNLLEHLSWQEVEQTLSEIKRVLKEKGKLIILQPNFKYAYREYFDDFTHIAIFTEKSLTDLLATYNFKIIKRIARFVPFSVDSRLPIIKPVLWLYLRSPIRPLAKQMYIVVENRKGEIGDVGK